MLTTVCGVYTLFKETVDTGLYTLSRESVDSRGSAVSRWTPYSLQEARGLYTLSRESTDSILFPKSPWNPYYLQGVRILYTLSALPKTLCSFQGVGGLHILFPCRARRLHTFSRKSAWTLDSLQGIRRLWNLFRVFRSSGCRVLFVDTRISHLLQFNIVSYALHRETGAEK